MSEDLTAAVRSKYGSIATSGLSTDHAGVKAVAEAFGYSAEELASIPAAANMGLSCGNPTATAHLKPGEVVVDLGSGGGLDVFLAAKKVGPTGKAIGIDMTPAMLELARNNARKAGATNVEFYQATIDQLPLPDNSVDCVISNCVINLAVDKPAVFREIARVLKPGGRLAVSDIALKQALPPEVGNDLMAYIGCIAGAILINEYRQGLSDAGFAHVEVVDTGADLNAYTQVNDQPGCCNTAPLTQPGGLAMVDSLAMLDSGCCGTGQASSIPHVAAVAPGDEAFHARLAGTLAQFNVNDFAASVRVYAVKQG